MANPVAVGMVAGAGAAALSMGAARAIDGDRWEKHTTPVSIAGAFAPLAVSGALLLGGAAVLATTKNMRTFDMAFPLAFGGGGAVVTSLGASLVGLGVAEKTTKL